MNVTYDTIAGAALIITLAYTVFGMTGFGSSITAVPLLAQLLPLRMTVPMMLVFDLCTGVLLGVRNRRAVAHRELLRLVPFMVVGMVLGVTLLVKAPERILLFVLGTFVLAYSGWTLLFRPSMKPIGTGWSAPLGTAGGVLTALFGTGGPVYVVYLARRIDDKAALRATNGTLIVVSGVARLGMFATAGLYAQQGLLRLTLWLLPCALLGLVAGSRLHRHLSGHRVTQLVWAILIVGGAGLVWRGIFTAR